MNTLPERPAATDGQLTVFGGFVSALVAASIYMMFGLDFPAHFFCGLASITLTAIFTNSALLQIKSPNLGIYFNRGKATSFLSAGWHIHCPILSSITQIDGSVQTISFTMDAISSRGARVKKLLVELRYQVNRDKLDRIVEWMPDQFRSDIGNIIGSNIGSALAKKPFVSEQKDNVSEDEREAAARNSIIGSQDEIEAAAIKSIIEHDELNIGERGYNMIRADINLPTKNAETKAAEFRLTGAAEADVQKKKEAARVEGIIQVAKTTTDAFSAAGAFAARPVANPNPGSAAESGKAGKSKTAETNTKPGSTAQTIANQAKAAALNFIKDLFT